MGEEGQEWGRVGTLCQCMSSHIRELFAPTTMHRLTLLALLALALATPPACFLSCTNEVAHRCGGQANLLCICAANDALQGCLVDICPYGNFESARDHFWGTCREHSLPIGSDLGVYAKPTASPLDSRQWEQTGADAMHYIVQRPAMANQEASRIAAGSDPERQRPAIHRGRPQEAPPVYPGE